jgi:hypothetical protein
MSGFRWQIEAFAGPAREAIIGGARLLVRVRLFNTPYESDLSASPPTKPDAWTDLRPGAARDLAFELLAAAEHAEILTARADYWEHER